ncbi:hypothetical protein LOTGIDRAFT_83370, partial [Lottia gigantea]
LYLRLYLLTWNVAEGPPVDLSEALELHKPKLPEVYAIGLQEVYTSNSETKSGSWSEAITKLLAPKGYVRCKERSMLGIWIIVFIRKQMLPYVTNIESERTKTGFGGYWGNKGGVSVRMDIYGVNVIIVNSHLAAHMENVQERIEDYDSILDDQKFKDEDVDHIMDHDYVFWMGDLNFRVNGITASDAIKCIKKDDYNHLLEHDQLLLSMKSGLVFDEFNEGDITFPPTYKFDKNTDHYDTSEKQRVPAWTDRILWYHHKVGYGNLRLNVQQKKYQSHNDYKSSDHRPVSSIFQFQVFPHPPSQPISFLPINEIKRKTDMTIKYTVDSTFMTNYNDWIGLYRTDFQSFNDYITYIWAVEGGQFHGEKGVTLKFYKSYMTMKPGNYCLIYLTSKYSICGISAKFKV